MSITIDKEFKSLIPPLSADEYAQLEKNILKDGIRDPLVIWAQPDGNDILIDGHNRWNISAKHGGIPFQTVEKKFADKEEAKAWIILNQFGRRNLSAYDRSVLALKLKPLIAEKQRQKQIKGGKEKVQQKSVEPTTTQKELARVAGVSHDTIHKVETIQNSGNDAIKEKVRSGEISINEGYKTVKGIPENKSPAKSKKEFINCLKQEHEEFQAKKEDGIVSFADIQQDRDNRETIAFDLWTRLMRMGERIEQIEIEQKQGEINLSEMAKTLPEADVKKLENYIHRLRSSLNGILVEVIDG